MNELVNEWILLTVWLYTQYFHPIQRKSENEENRKEKWKSLQKYEQEP